MRAGVDGLRSRHPLGRDLPALFQEDPFVQQFLAGLDEVLAPAMTVLDEVGAYVDPRTAPTDLLAWVGSWCGVEVDGRWPLERQRAAVRAAVRLHGLRGTSQALVEWTLLVCGLHAEVTESGGVRVSDLPGGELPGSPEPWVTVRLKGATAQEVAAARPVLRAWCPAHVRLEVLGPEEP